MYNRTCMLQTCGAAARWASGCGCTTWVAPWKLRKHWAREASFRQVSSLRPSTISLLRRTTPTWSTWRFVQNDRSCSSRRASFTLCDWTSEFHSFQDNHFWTVSMDEQGMQWVTQRPEDWRVGGKCESFLYGGCEGNINNFESYDACQKACSSEQEGSSARKHTCIVLSHYFKFPLCSLLTVLVCTTTRISYVIALFVASCYVFLWMISYKNA